jgi:predicted AlkP superfamily pyrophosphatase or phosphodiesterase
LMGVEQRSADDERLHRSEKTLGSHMSVKYDMRFLAPTVCGLLGVRPPSAAETGPLEEVVGEMGPQERLAVVVIDAFGSSTWAANMRETPTFNALANRRLLHLRSVMPSITPVNFATMLTGAGPEAHNIRDRTEKLALETIFDVLRERGKTSATAARALSSLGILISPHADRPGIAASNLDEEVKAIVIDHLRKGVHLLWVQLLDVDDAGHAHGPLSPQSVEACHRDDGHLREIAEAAYEEGYGLIVLADHGQHTVEAEDGVRHGTHGTDMSEDIYVPLVWSRGDELKGILGL